MEIVIVLAAIVFGIIVGRYLLPYLGTEIGILHNEIDRLIKTIEDKL